MSRRLAAPYLAATLALLAAPSSARAEDHVPALPPEMVMPVPDAFPVELHDQTYGFYATPALGGAGAFMALDLLLDAGPMVRSLAAAELVLGLLGSAWSGYLLAGAIEIEREDGLPIATYTTGMALALNARLTTSAAMRFLTADADAAVLAWLPAISVSPYEGGAVASLRWRI